MFFPLCPSTLCPPIPFQYVTPLLKPSLGEEVRRGIHRLADASAESYQRLSASSSSARALGSSQRATMPLLPKMSQSERPLMAYWIFR